VGQIWLALQEVLGCQQGKYRIREGTEETARLAEVDQHEEVSFRWRCTVAVGLEEQIGVSVAACTASCYCVLDNWCHSQQVIIINLQIFKHLISNY
jgi:hypothetical protein